MKEPCKFSEIPHNGSCYLLIFTNFAVIDGIDRIMNKPLSIPNREVKHDLADGTMKMGE